jgi:hypothetical protein
MIPKWTIPLTFIILLALMPSVMAVDFNLTNSTTRDVDDLAYPEALFYFVALIGAVMLMFNIRFITSNVVPGLPLMFTSVIGFMCFLICAYMAPMVAKMVWVVNAGDAQFISAYIFSPWVSYFCWGMSTICFIMIWWGLLRMWEDSVVMKKQRNDPEFQFKQYMDGK